MNRQEASEYLRSNQDWDVLVIGGGVNGIGTFRDLALQGISVLLVEKSDFCSGASAASSHMLHGGIRYLENGEFRLVREALHERNRLLKNAPHYAKPLPTTIPIFKWLSGALNAPLKFLQWFDKPSERGAAIIKIGLIMYDFYTRSDRVTPTHRFFFKKAALAKYPRLSPDIVCAATYYDAWMPYPERLCIDMLRDAQTSNDRALALNYMRASGGAGDTVTLTDELTNETYTVKPRVVINAAGPWIDFVNKAMNQSTTFIGGTKGSHLVLDHPELHEAAGGNEFFFENNDGRIVLIFPFMNRVMVGTTDIRIDDPEEAVCTDQEVDYILSMIPKVFPSIKVDRSHIVYTFSGVRPLPTSKSGRTGIISRDHSIETLQPGSGLDFPVHSLVSGKWTTFRAFSEQAADVALRNLGKQRSASTHNMAIGGGKDFPLTADERARWLQKVQERTHLPAQQLEKLLDRYGTYAADVSAFISAGHDTPLAHIPEYTQREIIFTIDNEQVVHLDDFFQRRSAVAMLGYAQPDAIREVADIAAAVLDWSDTVKEQQIQRVLAILQSRHHWNDL